MKLSYEQIRAAAARLKQNANNMQSLLNDVKSQMQKVNTEGVWKSQSAQKTYDTFEELSSKFPSFYEKVMSYADFLEKTVQAYEAADQAIAGKIN